jgi:hypothetical protein
MDCWAPLGCGRLLDPLLPGSAQPLILLLGILMGNKHAVPQLDLRAA